MSRPGFTIVELIVVIAIAAILITLGVVNLRSAQVNGRDVERKADIEALTQHLETFFTSGHDSTTTIGVYPSTEITTNATSMTQHLRDVDPDTLTAPYITDPTATFISATNATQTTAGVTPQPTISQYVYQPLQLSADGSTWSLCTVSASQECRKFNLYYRLEADNTVNMVSSINQ